MFFLIESQIGELIDLPHFLQAGIICQLNARTSILAAANPVESQWNPKKTTIENIQLPHTLLSRWASPVAMVTLTPHLILHQTFFVFI